MDNNFMMRFLCGYAIAKDRPAEERVMAGLNTGVLQPSNMMIGTVAVKQQVDRLVEKEKQTVEVEEKNVQLSKELEGQKNLVKRTIEALNMKRDKLQPIFDDQQEVESLNELVDIVNYRFDKNVSHFQSVAQLQSAQQLGNPSPANKSRRGSGK